ncbi:WecB/TagA/CpsF family glycosyltransferase [Chitinophaga sp. G-6-1-13]|uniref:WecB/TagA/CpsF family glycosyltransferase n=1 Tax=Chitinophaga fulva TaxID=2728842 RepID=A0A848GGJ6_9BACT|nr:WecB/TagA/CpsF family glycosyltransferase [Chitinophaga fulva]NML37256.1 WecB/TagA/CpsF family glycosyltransferase [Chitinophaga fulva]
METFNLRHYKISLEYEFRDIIETPIVINAINPHSWVVAEKDPEFRYALMESDYLIPDGIGIVLASRLLWKKKIKKFAGNDLHLMILKELNRNAGKCFYLGASDNVLNKIHAKLEQLYPNIRCMTLSPPYKDNFTREENAVMINQINDYSPDVLFVGMTAPKQEKWIFKHKSELNVKVMCAIGGAFDFFAGTKRRAPSWMINCGLEWLFRLMLEPKRMWKRNFVSTPLFIYNMLQLRWKRNPDK